MVYLKGKEVGSLHQMWPEQADQGVPTHWASYISVSNVEDTVKKAESLGGTIVAGPMDVFDSGRMAQVIDPTGSIFSIWEPLRHIGATLVNEHGTFVWNELATKDTKSAVDFYSELFGWTTDEMEMDVGGGMIYTIFMNGDRPAAGMMPIGGDMGDISPLWVGYFAVNDCNEIVEEAEALDGKIIVPPTDITDVGKFAFLTDSQGVAFAVIKLNKQPD